RTGWRTAQGPRPAAGRRPGRARRSRRTRPRRGGWRRRPGAGAPDRSRRPAGVPGRRSQAWSWSSSWWSPGLPSLDGHVLAGHDQLLDGDVGAALAVERRRRVAHGPGPGEPPGHDRALVGLVLQLDGDRAQGRAIAPAHLVDPLVQVSGADEAPLEGDVAVLVHAAPLADVVHLLVAVAVVGLGDLGVEPGDLLEAGAHALGVAGAQVDQEVERAVRVVTGGCHRDSSGER